MRPGGSGRGRAGLRGFAIGLALLACLPVSGGSAGGSVSHGIPPAPGGRPVAPHPIPGAALPSVNRTVVGTLDLRNQTLRPGNFGTASSVAAGPGVLDTATGHLVFVDEATSGLALVSPSSHQIDGAVSLPWPGHWAIAENGRAGIAYAPGPNRIFLVETAVPTDPKLPGERILALNGTTYAVEANVSPAPLSPTQGPAPRPAILAGPYPPLPVVLSPDAKRLFVPSQDPGPTAVSVLDAHTLALTANTTFNGSTERIAGLVADPPMHAVAATLGSAVALLNATTGTFLGNLTTVPDGPLTGLGFDPATEALGTFNATGWVDLNASTGAVEGVVPVSGAAEATSYGVVSLAYTPGTDRWAALCSPWSSGVLALEAEPPVVLVRNATDGSVLATLTVDPAYVEEMPMVAAGDTLYLPTRYGQGPLLEIDTSTPGIAGTLRLASWTLGLVFDPIDGRLFGVVRSQPGLVSFDPASGLVRDLFPEMGSNLTGVDVDPTTGTLYLIDGAHPRAYRVDPATLTLKPTTALPWTPAGALFVPGAQQLAVWNGTEVLSVDPLGGASTPIPVPGGISEAFLDPAHSAAILVDGGFSGYRRFDPANGTLSSLSNFSGFSLWPSGPPGAYDPGTGRFVLAAGNGSVLGAAIVGGTDLTRALGWAALPADQAVDAVGYDPALGRICLGLTGDRVAWLNTSTGSLERTGSGTFSPVAFAYSNASQDLFVANDPSDSVSIFSGLEGRGLSAVWTNFSLNGVIQSDVGIVAGTRGGDPPLSYAWSGGPASCSSTEAATLACPGPSPGDYEIRLRVTDALGATAVLSTNLTVAAPPSSLYANFSYRVLGLRCPDAGPGVADLLLSGSASGGRPPYAFLWHLPGGEADGPNVSTSFPVEGLPTVTLQVTDAAGITATVTRAPVLAFPTCGTRTLLQPVPVLVGVALGVVLLGVAAYALLVRGRSGPRR